MSPKLLTQVTSLAKRKNGYVETNVYNYQLSVSVDQILQVCCLIRCDKVNIFPLLSASLVHQRHSILEQTIGALPEEIEAYDTIKYLSPLMFLALIILTLVQLTIYFVFNRLLHPFKDILVSEDSEPIKLTTLETVSVATSAKRKISAPNPPQQLDAEALASNEAFRTMLEEQVKIAVKAEVSEKMQELETRLNSKLPK